MFKTMLAAGAAAAFFLAPLGAQAQSPVYGKHIPVNEPFQGFVVIEGLDSPWDMVWGPDDQIWVTERQGKRITSINPKTGDHNVLVTLEDVYVGPQHEGVLGLALDPDLGKAESKNHVYVAHTYMDGKKEYARIVRLRHDPKTNKLVEPTVILSGLPAGDDHNGGRLRFGPDGKLYYSIGEQGHNQGKNFCKPIEAQRLPTGKEVADKNWSAAYPGKVIRLNTDGSIPSDNPVLNGVRSHVYTYGHRNPQGLVFVGTQLFSSEHGPSTDDEINLLQAGGNYGWPHVAGFRDDQAYVYGNWSQAPDCMSLKYDANKIPASVPQQKETDWTAENFHEPLRTFYTVPNGYNFNDPRCDGLSYLCWATIAPSSITHYPADGPIRPWEGSLLVTSLKNGALYQLPMDGDTHVQGDAAKYFHTQNRYRVALVSHDGKTIYIATDKAGNVMDENGKPASKMANPGAILAFRYAPQANK